MKGRGHSPSQRLHALASPTLEELRSLLDEGADPDFAADAESSTSFLRLVGRVPLEGLRLLAEAGANLAARRPNTQEGALHVLLWAHPAPPDLEDQLAFLLHAGPEVNLRTALAVRR